ncbi:BC_2427 family protein, partial [Bacillus hominis]|uniref:BC_2427 family protein n=1 Tax=Bacillus hominis TaxID=2817478 RepID=UPI001BB45C8E
VETGSEKEDRESEKEKEDVETESEKEDVEAGSEEEDKESGLEKEDVETGSEEEDKESGLEKEDVETESEINTSVRFMVVKIPFSIISEVSRFLNYPNINVKKQEAFVFQNEKKEGYRELDAKLLTTAQHYHGEAYCKLVSSNLHEKRVLLEFSDPKVKDDIKENRIETSSWIPIHSMILEKGSEGEFNDYITAKLPIEIGRYKGEISLREKVTFKEKVIEIKGVSQEIILTKNEILLPKIKKTGQNPFTVEKGSLLVEGYIFQYIEYIIEQSTFHDNVYQLMQNIVLGLTVQVLQEQEVQVRIT